MRLPRFATALWRAVFAFDAHEGTLISGHFAFSSFLAVFPFAIFTIALTGGLVGQEGSVRAVEALFDVAPSHVAKTLEPVLREVLNRSSGGFLTLAAVVALWIASNAVEALRIGLDRAYRCAQSRSYIWRRVIAIGCVIAGALVAVGAGFMLLLGPNILTKLESRVLVSFSEDYFYMRHALAAAVFFVFLIGLHRILPAKRMALRHLWPGVLTTTSLWIAGAWAYLHYITFTQSYAVTYGALAGVIITLVYFYMTAVTILIGAEVNAELAKLRESEG